MKLEKIIQTIEVDLLNGSLGQSGNKFLTANELIDQYDISFVSALKILNTLTEKNLLIPIGNRKYIMNGLYTFSSELYKLRKKKIGILVQDIPNPFYAKVTEAINDVVLKNDFSPMVKIIHAQNEIPTLIELIAEGCSGLISFCLNHTPEILDIYERCPLPIVFINTEIPIKNCNLVNSDNYKSGVKAAKHLIEYGYDSLYLCNTSSDFDDPRFYGFIDQVNKCNLPFDKSHLLTFDSDFFSGKAILSTIQNDPAERVGIFCFHDLIAENLFNLCKLYDIAVPERVGIVGYDKLDTVIPLFANLTTFAYSFENIANSAVNLLLKNMRTLKPSNVHIEEPTIFLVRNTTSKKTPC